MSEKSHEKELHDEEVELLLAFLAMDLEAENVERRPAFVNRVQSRIAQEKMRKPDSPASATGQRGRPVLLGRNLRIAAAFFLIAVLGSFVWTRYRAFSPVGIVEYSVAGAVQAPGSDLERGMAISTDTEEGMSVALDDGRVRVLLAPDTRLILVKNDVISLPNGEIWVEVQPDSGRFEVQTSAGSAIVTGTSFGVAADDSGTRVTLVRGGVTVSNGGGEVVLEPGMEALMSGPKTTPSVQSTALRQPPDWALGILFLLDRGGTRGYFPSIVPDKKGQVKFDQ